MGEYADMEIAARLENYMRGNSYNYRQANPREFEDMDGEIIYVNKETGEVIMSDVKAGKEIQGKCHSCGGKLFIRKNSKTDQFFIGCSGFPKCKQTYSL